MSGRAKTVIAAFVVLAAALASARYLQREKLSEQISAPPSVTLTSPKFVEDTSVLQFQPFDVQWLLRNTSDESVAVESSDQSVGWQFFENDDAGERLALPFVLSAKEELRFRGRVDTATRGGRVRPILRLSCRNASLPFVLESSITLRVRPAWVACPRSLTIGDTPSGETVRKAIDIYDAYPDRGIDITRVEASNEDRIKVDVTRIQPSEAVDLYVRHPGQWEIPEQDAELRYHHRYRLEISCTVPPRGVEVSEQIRILSGNQHSFAVPPLLVPVIVRPASVEYELAPARLDMIVESPSRSGISRKVLFRSFSGSCRDLFVKAAPGFVRVSVLPADVNTKLLEVHVGELASSERRYEGDVLIGFHENPERLVRLPVSLMQISP